MAQVQPKKIEKTESKKSNGTSRKVAKKSPLDKVFSKLARLQKDSDLVAKRVKAWSVAESQPSERVPLLSLVAAVEGGNYAAAMEVAAQLKEAGYEPPRGVGPAPRAEIEAGVQVWLRKNVREKYAAAFPNGELDNLYVDGIFGGAVRLRVGPKGPPAGTFLLGQVSASAPPSGE